MPLAPELVSDARALLTGPTTPEDLLAALRKEGLEPVLISGPGPNVVVRYSGTGKPTPSPAGALLLCCRFEADPAAGALWGPPPDPRLELATCAGVLLQLARSKAVLQRDVILAVVSDGGAQLLVEKHPELVRAEWALVGPGGFMVSLRDQRLYPIRVAQRGSTRLTLTANGLASALPDGDSAPMRPARSVMRLGNMALPIHVTPPARAMLDALGSVGGLGVRLLKSPALADFSLQSLVEDPEIARALSAVVRNTAIVTGLRSNGSPGALPSSAEATVEGGRVPGETTAAFLKELDQVIDDDDVKVAVVQERPALESPVGTPLYQRLEAAVRAMDPAGVPFPWLAPGTSDATAFAGLGATTYGFAPAVRRTDAPDAPDTESFQQGLQALCDVVNGFCS